MVYYKIIFCNSILQNMKKSKKSRKEAKQEQEQEQEAKQEHPPEILPDENIVRKISNFLQPYIHPLIGIYYASLHLVIMFFAAIILLFDTNIYHLIVLFAIVIMDSMSCVFLHNCPLTNLERKYLGHSLFGTRASIYKNMNICYKCDHEYENTIEFLSNIGALILGKILILMTSKLFSIEFTVSFKNDPVL